LLKLNTCTHINKGGKARSSAAKTAKTRLRLLKFWVLLRDVFLLITLASLSSSHNPKQEFFLHLLMLQELKFSGGTRAKVQWWKLKLLSFAGRVELIRSVLHNLLAYWIFSFKLPASVIRNLEGIYANME